MFRPVARLPDVSRLDLAIGLLMVQPERYPVPMVKGLRGHQDGHFVLPHNGYWIWSETDVATGQKRDRKVRDTTWCRADEVQPWIQDGWATRPAGRHLIEQAYLGKFEFALVPPPGWTSWIVLDAQNVDYKAAEVLKTRTWSRRPPGDLPVDVLTGFKAGAMADQFRAVGIAPLTVRTPNGGVQTYVPFGKLVPQAEAIRLANAVVMEAGFVPDDGLTRFGVKVLDGAVRMIGTRGSDLVDTVQFEPLHLRSVTRRTGTIWTDQYDQYGPVGHLLDRKAQFDDVMDRIAKAIQSDPYGRLQSRFPNPHNSVGNNIGVLRGGEGSCRQDQAGPSGSVGPERVTSERDGAAGNVTSERQEGCSHTHRTFRDVRVQDDDRTIRRSQYREFANQEAARARRSRKPKWTRAELDAFARSGPQAAGSRIEWYRELILRAAQHFETVDELVQYGLDAWKESHGGASLLPGERRDDFSYMRSCLTNWATKVVRDRHMTVSTNPYGRRGVGTRFCSARQEKAIRHQAERLRLDRHVTAAMRIAPMVWGQSDGQEDPSNTASIHCHHWILQSGGLRSKRRNPATGHAYYITTREAVLKILNLAKVGGYRPGRYAQRYCCFRLESVCRIDPVGRTRVAFLTLDRLESGWGRAVWTRRAAAITLWKTDPDVLILTSKPFWNRLSNLMGHPDGHARPSGAGIDTSVPIFCSFW